MVGTEKKRSIICNNLDYSYLHQVTLTSAKAYVKKKAKDRYSRDKGARIIARDVLTEPQARRNIIIGTGIVWRALISAPICVCIRDRCRRLVVREKGVVLTTGRPTAMGGCPFLRCCSIGFIAVAYQMCCVQQIRT